MWRSAVRSTGSGISAFCAKASVAASAAERLRQERVANRNRIILLLSGRYIRTKVSLARPMSRVAGTANTRYHARVSRRIPFARALLAVAMLIAQSGALAHGYSHDSNDVPAVPVT